ncbi:hypothetical protein FOBRF1_011982 [Fusarium oxysporum]
MGITRVEIDPEGDALIILPVKPASIRSDTPESPAEKHYLCSKKHLTLASRRAAKLFSSQFREASVQSDGLYHWRFEGIFNAEAYELVLKIVHGKTRDVPRNVKLDLLADIATIVDDLECHEAVAFFSTNWLFGWPVGLLRTEELRDKPLAQLILASLVFEHASLFETYTKMAIRHNIDVISTYELPIRADVSDKIQSTRIDILQRLLDGLENLQTKILAGKVGCNEACRAMLLGSLLQGMKNSGIYPRPSSPFPKLSPGAVLASLAIVQSPAFFGPENQGPLFNYSGRWNLDNTSASFVAGGLFSPAPQSTTTPQDTHKLSGPPQPPGSLFGTPLSQSSSTPRERSSLFGSNASSSAVPKPTVVESEEQPATLVRHNCRLKGLIEPLIHTAQEEITGLKLANFPRP